MIDIDFWYQSMDMNQKKKKVVTLINIDDFPMEIDNDFLIDIDFVNR